MTNFPTPRLLLEIRRDEKWHGVKIYCDYVNARGLLAALPRLAREYDIDLDAMRVKNLRTTSAIADAKLDVYHNEIQKG